MPSRSVPFGVKPRTWSATSSPRKPSMGSPASNPYAPTPRACWIPAANTGVLKTVSTTFATSPLMKIARASAVAQAPRSWPPFAISPYRFSASPELATSPQHFAAVLVRAIPSSFASSGCDFDVAVVLPYPLHDTTAVGRFTKSRMSWISEHPRRGGAAQKRPCPVYGQAGDKQQRGPQLHQKSVEGSSQVNIER